MLLELRNPMNGRKSAEGYLCFQLIFASLLVQSCPRLGNLNAPFLYTFQLHFQLVGKLWGHLNFSPERSAS